MSKKGKIIIPAIAVIFIIVSVIFNIYQFNSNDKLKSEIATLESEIKTLETENDTLNKEIESKQTTVSDLSLQIEDLQKKIEQLKADNQSLSDSLEALENEFEGDNADIDVGYVSLDDVVDKVLEEYYQSNPNQAPTPYQGPPVGTPDSGELPTGNLKFGEVTSDVPAGTVYCCPSN